MVSPPGSLPKWIERRGSASVCPSPLQRGGPLGSSDLTLDHSLEVPLMGAPINSGSLGVLLVVSLPELLSCKEKETF